MKLGLTLDQARGFIEDNPEWREFADLLVSPPDNDEIVSEYPEAAWDLGDIDGYIWVGTGMWIGRSALYFKMRKCGEGHAMSVMCASQKAPRALTDRELFEGIGPLASQFDDDYVSQIVYAARKQGYNPNPNEMYMPNLARFPGDKEAFVPATGGRGHIKKICEQRGLPCEGAVNVKGAPPREVKVKPLGEDIINRHYKYSRDPEIIKAKRKGKREAREAIIAKHGNTRHTL